ncbi:hypothetical protein HGRIS_014102 [Hohenbuehelia grisea]|uniref:3-carboxy-cis,cis-mucoante lactonizing enzyme n=1 Tax=Hohenbuehelia grisea TaxID=104357 RepID=A0ABR3JUI3_9AGAR
MSGMDQDIQATFGASINTTNVLTSTSQPTHHILSGSFRSLSLFLLAFSPVNRSLWHVQTVPAFGPHQYVGLSYKKDRAYTTSWAQPPTLSSWAVIRDPGWHDWQLKHVNTVPITATSSYITIPPPFRHVYSAGGPTGEVHNIDESTGGFGKKVDQLLFVSPHELPTADKTRVALRYGSHAFEFSPHGYAFIPVLGTNTIETYVLVDDGSGRLKHLDSVSSPRPHDGPRHLVVSPDGNTLYVVTEHTNYLDVYSITASGALEHVQSRSLLPAKLRTTEYDGHFRGDTLRLSPSTQDHPAPRYLFATTRGASPETKGWLAAFALGDNGHILGPQYDDDSSNAELGAERWETPTSGGKANAIDVIAMDPNRADDSDAGVWIVLTDDEAVEHGQPGVRVLEWRGWGMGGPQIVAEWPSVDFEAKAGEESMRGGSHAVWLD